MGLWEEGKGVCCLYPMSPPNSMGPGPRVWGWGVDVRFGGLWACARILGGRVR